MPFKHSKPSDARIYSVDLIPADAYWRAPYEHEQKIDFAEMEVQEGRALESARLQIGAIFAAQMEGYVKIAKSDRLTPGTIENLPILLESELASAFGRFATRAYFDGFYSYGRWKQRAQAQAGMEAEAQPLQGLTDAGLKDLRAQGAIMARDQAEQIRSRIRQIMRAAFSPRGERILSKEDLEMQIRGYFATLFEPAPRSYTEKEILRLADSWHGDRPVLYLLADGSQEYELARRMKIRDLIQYERWQKRRLPLTKFMKQSASKIVGRDRPPRASTDWSKKLLQTKRTEFFNAAVTEAGREDPETVAFVYTTLRDGRVCLSICLPLDGIIRTKADDFWARFSPPLHMVCRCSKVPIFRWEKAKVTPKKETWEVAEEVETEIPAGFGMYDPKVLRSAKSLGFVPPKRTPSYGG